MFMHLMLVVGAMAAGTAGPLSAVATAPPADRWISVAGVSVHYVDWGGTGDALVFLPPACETAHIFGDIAPAFTDRFRVLGPTTRGCGASGRPGAYDLGTQVKELAGFLDALGIERATVAGFSASGGKAIRFAREYSSRVRSLVVFDPVYAYVAPGLEEKVAAAITRRLGGGPGESLTLFRQHHEAWELGAWSDAMERNLRGTQAVSADGTLRPVAAPEWSTAFAADMKAGRYFETRISQPTLMFFPVDLDTERLKQFDEKMRAEIRPLAEETDARRRRQIDEFRKNGSHVRIIEMPATAHYLFVQKPEEVIRAMREFLAHQ